jgi:glucoamylase
MMTRMTGRTGLIPEQIWDGPPVPERGLEPGKPTGSVMPLVWAHAEFLKLLRARQEKRPIELLNSVEKHLRRKPGARRRFAYEPEPASIAQAKALTRQQPRNTSRPLY